MSAVKKRKKRNAKAVTRRDTRRRVEQFAANAGCEANVLSVVHDVPMADVARLVGLNPKVGQSRFAIARGHQFERSLFRRDAEKLRAALVRANVLPPNSTGFLDLRLKTAGGPCPDLDSSRARFEAMLASASSGDGSGVPTIIAGPPLRAPGNLFVPDGIVALDVATVHVEATRIVLRVGEVKVYPDRGGHTDSGQLARARAQAGLYVHMLRLTLSRLGLEASLSAADDGFLVLSRAGRNEPGVRSPEDFRWQARRAAVGLERLLAAARADLPLRGKRRLEAVRDASKCYGDGCVARCELADRCHDEALEQGNAAALGSAVARFLGAVPLQRAVELMNGAAPTNASESDVLRRMAQSGGMR